MLPGVDGFSWSAGNLIFLGVFYTVALIIAATTTYAVIRAILDFKLQKAEVIRWEADFEDLPVLARACRHELTREVKRRTCENGFECGKCPTHPVFLKARGEAAGTKIEQAEGEKVLGFEMPQDRFYHRGHTWVRPEPDGTLTVGLDDFGTRLLGTPDAVELPQIGARLRANGTACRVRKDGSSIRILSPVDGEVVEAATMETGWLLRLKPADGSNTRHLLQGAEIRPWIMREIERLEFALASEGVGLSLADGGEVVSDVPAAYPNAAWDGVWSEIFLEP
jgi:glycine cleavage system H lipoate-binding protein